MTDRQLQVYLMRMVDARDPFTLAAVERDLEREPDSEERRTLLGVVRVMRGRVKQAAAQ